MLSCLNTCQDPQLPLHLACMRTKPYWLGLLQGLVTILRLWILHILCPDGYVIGYHPVVPAAAVSRIGAHGQCFLCKATVPLFTTIKFLGWNPCISHIELAALRQVKVTVRDI